MISLRQIGIGLGILVTGILTGIVIVPRKKHYSLYSPQNLARLARGRDIRRQQQLQISAVKREQRRQRLLTQLAKL